MSGYVEAGYAIALAAISAYSVSILWRERAARRRLGGRSGTAGASRRNGSKP